MCQLLLARFILLFQTYVIVIAFSQDISKELCFSKDFNATCNKGVIIVTSARYGRMRQHRCLKRATDLGCSDDALVQVDKWCSGKRDCSFKVSDLNNYYRSCAELDRFSYLEITYRCQEVFMAEKDVCIPGRNISVQLTDQITTLSNIMAKNSNKGTSECPLSIKAPPGKIIKVHLINFKREIEAQQGIPKCFKYAIIKVHGHIVKEISDCEQKDRKLEEVYVSKTSEIQVELDNTAVMHFLLEFEATGCIDEPGWPHVNGLWIKKNPNKEGVAIARCNSTKREWTKTCINGKWRGFFGNCTGSTRIHTRLNHEKGLQNGEPFPYGILIVVAIGVALGVFLGGLLLICAARVIRRRQKHPRANNPDMQYASATEYIPREDMQQYTTADQKCTLTGTTTAHGYKTCHTGGHTCTNTMDKDKFQQCYGTLPPGYHCSPNVLRSYGHFYDTDTTAIQTPHDPV